VSAAALLAGIALIALTTGAGTFVVGLSGCGRSLEETLGWSWAAGMLLLAAVYAALLAAGARPGPKKLVPILVIAAIGAFLRRRPRRRGARERDLLATLLAAAAAAGCVAYALQALAEPLWSTDFLAIWGLKGKTIYFTGAIPGRIFHDPATVWSHPEYPLFVPLAMAAFSAATGSWNDETLGLLYAAWQVATVLVVLGYGRRRGSVRAGAAAAALVAWFHPLYRGFGVGLADVPFALAAVLLATAAADRDPVGAGVAALIASATKQEGLLLSILAASLLLLFGTAGDRLARRRVAAIVAATAGMHLLLLRSLRGPIANRDFTFAPLAHAADLAARIGRLLPALAGSMTFALLVGIAAAAAVFLAGRRSREDVLLAALALQVAAYLAACVLSAYDPIWQLQGFFRTSGALVPAAALLLAARVGRSADTSTDTGAFNPRRSATY